jgi:hypothetical protein
MMLEYLQPTAESPVQHGLKEVIEALTDGGLAGFQLADFGYAAGEFL